MKRALIATLALAAVQATTIIWPIAGWLTALITRDNDDAQRALNAIATWQAA